MEPLDSPSTAHSPLLQLSVRELSPLLTLLDALVGHRQPLVPPVAGESWAGEAAAVLDVGGEGPVFGRFLRSAWRTLAATLDSAGLELAWWPLRSTATKPPLQAAACICLVSVRTAVVLSRHCVLGMIRGVEERLAEPAVVLDHLMPAAEAVMRACVDFIAERCGSYLDVERLRRCVMQPGTFFGEEWSLPFEIAWQASGAEGILTIPNYVAWTEAHKQHLGESWRGANSVHTGRLWRFEFWDCLRTPCHEVIHLVQHIAGQRMSTQAAEHDGAFSTYLLMLALAAQASGQRVVWRSGGCSRVLLPRRCGRGVA